MYCTCCLPLVLFWLPFLCIEPNTTNSEFGHVGDRRRWFLEHRALSFHTRTLSGGTAKSVFFYRHTYFTAPTLGSLPLGLRAMNKKPTNCSLGSMATGVTQGSDCKAGVLTLKKTFNFSPSSAVWTSSVRTRTDPTHVKTRRIETTWTLKGPAKR